MSEHNTKTTNDAGDRALRVLEHAERYRLATVESLSRTVLPQHSRNAINKIVNRLCDRRLLQKYTLLHPVRYFVPGECGARLLGTGSHRVAPLGPQALPMEFAVLAYATLGKQPRLRLTAAEVIAHSAWMPTTLAEAPHTTDQAGVLELLRVDLGGPADHVARKCRADITVRRRLRQFATFVTSGGFRLVLITGTARKADAIRRSLDRHDWPHGLLIHISVVPRLLSLSARQSNA
jgi:hypothetical protein